MVPYQLRSKVVENFCDCLVSVGARIGHEFGRLRGDEILKAVAQAIQSSVRRVDVVARFGGEEFVVLMPETPINEAMRGMERLRECVESLELPLRNITVSIGLAMLSETVTDVPGLLVLAEKALCQAKTAGRNRVVSAGPWNAALAA